MIQIKSAVRLRQTFLDLIFLMQLSLVNKKSFGKWAKLDPLTKTFLVPQWYLHQKNKVYKSSFNLS